MKPIYLDNAATTPIDPRVLASMNRVLAIDFGNPSSSSHEFGWRAAQLVELARKDVASLIGARPEQIIFTSGATESNNLALKGALFHRARSLHASQNKLSHCKIVSCLTEHSSVLEPIRYLEQLGFPAVLLPVNRSGNIDKEALVKESASCCLVSLMAVNNETGVIHDLQSLLPSLAPNSDVLIHCDATQALGKQHLNLSDLPIDLLSISAHKIYGPKGIGALFIREEKVKRQIDPLLHGGPQERGLRGGTLNTAAIVGFGEACKIMLEEQDAHQKKIRTLSALCHNLLLKHFPVLEINGGTESPTGDNTTAAQRVPHILNVNIPGLDHAHLFGKTAHRIAISTGSACTTQTGEKSHVLTAMGLPDKHISSSIRFSFSHLNTEEEIAEAISIIAANFKG